jgi:hypothetical protein
LGFFFDFSSEATRHPWIIIIISFTATWDPSPRFYSPRFYSPSTLRHSWSLHHNTAEPPTMILRATSETGSRVFLGLLCPWSCPAHANAAFDRYKLQHSPRVSPGSTSGTNNNGIRPGLEFAASSRLLLESVGVERTSQSIVRPPSRFLCLQHSLRLYSARTLLSSSKFLQDLIRFACKAQGEIGVAKGIVRYSTCEYRVK